MSFSLYNVQYFISGLKNISRCQMTLLTNIYKFLYFFFKILFFAKIKNKKIHKQLKFFLYIIVLLTPLVFVLLVCLVSEKGL